MKDDEARIKRLPRKNFRSWSLRGDWEDDVHPLPGGPEYHWPGREAECVRKFLQEEHDRIAPCLFMVATALSRITFFDIKGGVKERKIQVKKREIRRRVGKGHNRRHRNPSQEFVETRAGGKETSLRGLSRKRENLRGILTSDRDSSCRELIPQCRKRSHPLPELRETREEMSWGGWDGKKDSNRKRLLEEVRGTLSTSEVDTR